jgi:hypothetical protein
MRALVYAEGGEIPGPDLDPHGWKVCDPVNITGTLFDVRDVSLQHTASSLFTQAQHNAEPRACAACRGYTSECLFAPLLQSRSFSLSHPVHICEQFPGAFISYAPRHGRAGSRSARQRYSPVSATHHRDWLGSGRGGWPPAKQEYVPVERCSGRVLAVRSAHRCRIREGSGGGPGCSDAARRSVHSEGDEAVLCISAVRVQGEFHCSHFGVSQGRSYNPLKKQLVHHRSSVAAGIWLYLRNCTRGTAPHGAYYGHNGQCTGYQPSITDSTWL